MTWLDDAEARLIAVQTQMNSSRLTAEAKSFGLLRPWFQFAAYRMTLYAATKTNDPQIKEIWLQTKAAYDAMQRWGAKEITDPLYRQNFKFMQFVFCELRLRRICFATFEKDEFRRGIADLVTVLKIIKGFALMAWKYKRHKWKAS
jgi:hypothetical protein